MKSPPFERSRRRRGPVTGRNQPGARPPRAAGLNSTPMWRAPAFRLQSPQGVVRAALRRAARDGFHDVRRARTVCSYGPFGAVVAVTGVEPASAGSKTSALPLSYTNPADCSDAVHGTHAHKPSQAPRAPPARDRTTTDAKRKRPGESNLRGGVSLNQISSFTLEIPPHDGHSPSGRRRASTLRGRRCIGLVVSSSSSSEKLRAGNMPTF
jgi:hypothetical protein